MKITKRKNLFALDFLPEVLIPVVNAHSCPWNYIITVNLLAFRAKLIYTCMLAQIIAEKWNAQYDYGWYMHPLHKVSYVFDVLHMGSSLSNFIGH